MDRIFGVFPITSDGLRDSEKSAVVSLHKLLERGNIRRLKGDIPGAQQDWLRVAKLAPGSAEEAAAKANIERLDVKDEPAPAATPGPRQ